MVCIGPTAQVGMYRTPSLPPKKSELELKGADVVACVGEIAMRRDGGGKPKGAAGWGCIPRGKPIEKCKLVAWKDGLVKVERSLCLRPFIDWGV